MSATDPHTYLACLAAIVSGGVSAFVDPGRGTVQKWTYWCIAPVIAVVCFSLAFGVKAGLAFGVVAVFLAVAGYFRFHAQK